MSTKRPFPAAASLAILGIALLWPSTNGFAQQASIAYENANQGVNYVGTDQCIHCHRDQHASYLKTTHSIATVETEPDGDSEPAKLKHPVLNVHYEVRQRDGRLVHREIVPDQQGETIAETEKAIAYTVGSGAHAKSYLFREGGFLGQSPLTWYEQTKAIGMSPGFEGPFQPSFQRKISTECVFCHVGRIDFRQHNPYRFEILETSIGCERCHGPGELHVNRYRVEPDAIGDDLTIVNPQSLSRELAEAICQQCHLQGANWVVTSGHEMWDFRPSQRLTDVRVDYQLTRGGEGMRIVGHVEQMHASECYKDSDTLTCTTCHPPHNPIAKADRIDFYRRVCLDCHADQSCGLPLAERTQRAANNCYQCHMPKADTNVTHAAFHHHRIGVHDQEKDNDKHQARGLQLQAQLIPVLDVSGLSEREQTRCLSIAQVLHLRDDPNNPDFYHFGHQATAALIKLQSSGPVDGMSDAQLALLAVAQNQIGIARGLATQALIKEPRPTMARIEATELLARLSFQDGHTEHSAQYYQQLTRFRRDARDHLLLGLCQRKLGDNEAAITSLKRSLEINPLLPGPHAALHAIYADSDQSDKATFHEHAERRITEYMQSVQAQAQRPGQTP